MVILPKKMKKFNGFLLLAAILCGGCVAEPKEINVPQLEQGVMKVEFLESFPFTKGDVAVEASAIEDVNLYIFDAEGVPVYSKFFPDGNIGAQEVTLLTKSSYSVYALANWGKEEKVLSLQQLLGLSYRAEDIGELCEGNGTAIMTGCMEDVTFPFESPLPVRMERIVGKITLKCRYNAIDKNVTLTVKSVALKNVPLESSLFGDNVAAEVADGITVDRWYPLQKLNSKGLSFYMFENLQGAVPGAVGNKDKALMLGEQRRQVCSYVEIVANIVSKKHRGDMVYRFFLGTSDEDCNVLRNNDHRITVSFKGTVSENENSVSVDNGALLDRVTDVRVTPSYIVFTQGLGKTFQCGLTVSPETAYDKRVTWYSSDKNIVKVDQNGLMTTVSPGYCEVYAKSVDNPQVQGLVMIDVR